MPQTVAAAILNQNEGGFGSWLLPITSYSFSIRLLKSTIVDFPRKGKRESKESLTQCFHSSGGLLVDEAVVHDTSHVSLDCLGRDRPAGLYTGKDTGSASDGSGAASAPWLGLYPATSDINCGFFWHRWRW